MVVQAFANAGLPLSNAGLQDQQPAIGQPPVAIANAPAAGGAVDAFQQAAGPNAAVAGGIDAFQAPAAQAPDAAAATPPAGQGGGGLLENLGKFIQQVGDLLKSLGQLLTGGGGAAPQNPQPQAPNPNPNPAPAPTPQTPAPAPAPGGGGNDPVKNFFETEMGNKIKANPQLAKDINAPINFNVTGAGGGQWGVDLRKQSDWVQPGQIANPKATISISAEDFKALRAGTLDGMAAFQQGRIKFEPFDMGIAMKLGDLLK